VPFFVTNRSLGLQSFRRMAA